MNDIKIVLSHVSCNPVATGEAIINKMAEGFFRVDTLFNRKQGRKSRICEKMKGASAVLRRVSNGMHARFCGRAAGEVILFIFLVQNTPLKWLLYRLRGLD